MQSIAPVSSVAVPATAGISTKAIILIIVGVVVTGVIILGAVGIALGVGLGVGLSKKNSDSSSSSSGSSSSSSSSSSGLSAPSVSCTYNIASCGCAAVSPSFLSSKITSGYTATANSWPWIVALYINNGASFCGGFLISAEYVVTAAHCVSGITASTIQVYAGIQTLSNRASGQVRTASVVTVNPSYSSSALTADIAIVKVSSAFTLGSTVGFCCLPSDTSLPTIGQTGVIAGWGTTSQSSTTPSDNLLQGVIQVQSDSSSCSTSTTSSIRFCAGYSGIDACFGDSGGPFMISSNNAWTCAGIVSAGKGCGTNSLYTRVSAYRSFISSTTGI